MQPSIRTLGAILYSPSQYVIPVFQRNYRWEEPQWEKLWNSLLEIRSPDKKGNHFMGFLVFVPGLPQPGQNTTFHLIDGQQRLTTLSILLAAIRNVARDSGQDEFADEVHQYYLVHPIKKGEQHYRLLPKERDHDTYLAIVNDSGEPTGRMVEALAYFESQLVAASGDNAVSLRSIFDTVTQRLEFLCATLEKEDAYNIFKSLNSTGVPLSESDLIRNFIFMHVPPDDQDEFDSTLWAPLEVRFTSPHSALDEDKFSKFFRDFLMSDGRYVSPRDTFTEFEGRYEATDFSPKVLASALLKASAHYEVIRDEKPDGDERVTQALRKLNVLESSTTYPLILKLFLSRDEGKLDAADLARAIEMLSGFILRRFICNESSRGYGRMFVRALSSNEGESPVNALEQYLLDRGWPDDGRFEAAFVRFPLYQRGYTREVMEALEVARGHKEPADLTSVQVEHIMPQTLNVDWVADLGSDAERVHGEWLDTPGNLALSAYNQELWNHKFAIKRTYYEDSNVVITRELATRPQWGEPEIQERGRELAKAAAKIWIGPERPPTPTKVNGNEQDESRFEVRRKFWEGLHDYLQSESLPVPDFEVRPVWTVRLPSSTRHIGIETRLGLRNQVVGIDIWFWREESMPLWHEIKASPTPYNEIVGQEWRFEQLGDRPRASMTIELPVENLRNPASWSPTHEWFGRQLALIYEKLFPLLRKRMEEIGADAKSA